MLYTVGDAAAGPLVETDHIFRIAIADGQEIAKLALAGGIIGQQIGGLYIDYQVATSGYEINLTSSWLLTREYFEATVQEMQVHGVFYEFVDVALEIEAKMAVAQAKILKIVFVANLKRASYVFWLYLINTAKINILFGITNKNARITQSFKRR